MMNSVALILGQLSATSSRNAKLEILSKESGNTLLKEVVRLALDPFINFYQRVIPEYESFGTPTISLTTGLGMLKELSERRITGNAAKTFLADLLASMSFDDAEVLSRVVLKDLKCGVQESTANAVWKGLVPKYPVMLCNEMNRELIEKMKFPVYVQTKMDGLRVNAHVNPSGTVILRSRTGKEIDLMGQFNGVFTPQSEHYVIDGELLVVNKEQMDYEPRKIGNGILNKAIRGTISEEEASRVVMVVWDMIPIGEFRGTASTHTPYDERLDALRNLVAQKFTNKVRLVDTFVAINLREVDELFAAALEHGEEGVVVKSMDGIWADKRPKYQVKMKAELECDLRITQLNEGTGKYAGSLGAIVCESDDSLVVVEVGTGLTDVQRASIWADKDNVVGKVAAVKYNARIGSKDRAGVDSLFLPVFVEIRTDKVTPNTSAEIK